MRHAFQTVTWVFALALIIGFGTSAFAEEDPPGSHRNWGISWNIRAGSAGGEYGDFMEKGTAWDLDIYKQKGNWRYGVGIMFSSMRMTPPNDNQPEWAHFETFGYASRVFRNQETLRPYLQGRFAIARMHPRSELFLKEPEGELDDGESPTDAVNGIGLSFIPGFEFELTRGFALDLSAYFNWYITEKYSLQDYLGNRPVDAADPGNGTEYGIRVGATWRPLSHVPPEHARTASRDTTPLDPPSKHKDAWGVTVSPGWAAAEVLAINFGASMFNEYVRQANFNQISPRSFWSNLEDGFNFDDNKFKTNQYVHPFNGSTYFNSGRANGVNFWGSSVCAIVGAFIWEAMGETHPMSYNDMISTGIGGMAFGETMYRVSSSILDNKDTGSSRTWREIGAFLVDPIRGFNRFLSGRATRVEGNPADPNDWRPLYYRDQLGVGAWITGRGESIKDSTDTQTFIVVDLHHGNPWDNARRKPFDHFTVGWQFNGDDKQTLGRLQIRGDWFSKGLGDPDDRNHAIAFAQYFDYVNNFAYEFGGQSFGGALYSRFRPSANLAIRTRVDLTGMILGAVNTEYSYLAVVPSQEREREYDYGSGGGLALEAAADYKRFAFNMFYRGQVLNVKNGSIYNPDDTGLGFEADHLIQAAAIGAHFQIRDTMSIAGDAGVFLRESHYSNPDLVDGRRRVPQAKLYLSWNIAPASEPDER
jgi:hypothetical protein